MESIVSYSSSEKSRESSPAKSPEPESADEVTAAAAALLDLRVLSTLVAREWKSLYALEELVPGKEVTIPWPTKGGIEQWKAVLVDSKGRFS